MIELRPGKPGEEPAQHALWRDTFGDEQAYIDAFYKNCYRPENAILLWEDGVLLSMCILVETTLALPDGTRHTIPYLYALATHPDARKRGLAGEVLNYCDFYARQRGWPCLCLVPAQPALHRYFQRAGFMECFGTRKLELLPNMIDPPSPQDELEEITPQAYHDLRKTLLEGVFHMEYPVSYLEQQRVACQLTGGGLYAVRAGGHLGVAALEYHDAESLLAKELLIAPAAMPAAVAQIAKGKPALRYHIRNPLCWLGMQGGYGQPFGMLKWYDKTMAAPFLAEKTAYLGLALD